MSLKDDLTGRLGGRMRAAMGPADVDGPRGTAQPAGPEKHAGMRTLRDAALVPLDRLMPDPGQPRKSFPPESIERLAASLERRGLLQPIRARWDADLARWVILVGERRFRAAIRLGWAEIPCVVVDRPMTESEIISDQLIENMIRDDLAPIEQGHAYRQLMELNRWSSRRLAEELQVSHQTILRAISLVELPPDVQALVESGDLPPRTAAEIATIDDPGRQSAVAEMAVAEKMTRDQVAGVVRASKHGRWSPGDRPRRPRKIMKVDGHKIIVEGPAADDEATLATLLRRAARTLSSDAA